MESKKLMRREDYERGTVVYDSSDSIVSFMTNTDSEVLFDFPADEISKNNEDNDEEEYNIHFVSLNTLAVYLNETLERTQKLESRVNKLEKVLEGRGKKV